ncbi:hypothetical protein RD792_012225 [Penstemon davidsonii]|uniref:WAT1-related protein n=1 Tax=Penstemon davidsonii TaxID=160366 RepID=A0ABR0CWQ0_9LAMI|nr:hypothetical protein RD792_012225 [Penstemon davidsonii]
MKALVMGCLQNQKALIGMIITQFIYAGMSVLSKAAISSGMKPSIFVSYRQAIATLALAPFAFFFQRESAPPLTFYMLFKIFTVSSCGMSLSLNLYYAALNYASATFATALTNTIPVMVFIVALCLRIERLAIIEYHGMAKVFGTILAFSGSMALTFYKGPALYSGSKNHVSNISRTSYTEEEWIKGCILLLAANLAWAMWLIMQGPLIKQYPAKLRLTTLQCGFCCITSTIYGAAVERNLSSWKLGWDVHLLSIAYSGILVTGITFTLQVWVVEKKGPVYAAIFSPLALVVTAFFSALFLDETLHWGSILGGALLVAGLYSYLWGKSKETTQIGILPSKPQPPLECIITSKSPNHVDK